MFNKSRLTVARQRAGLTMKELAAKAGIDPRTVTGYEAGEYLPSDETARKLSRILQFPLSFFMLDDVDVPRPEGVSFRSMSKMTARQRDGAIAAGAIAFLLSDWLDAEFNLPSASVPDMREDTPQSAAAALRDFWALGNRPIKNMVHLLELKGVRVFSLGEDGKEVDAFSVWRDDRPYIFLNSQKSAERSRFDAAHELGHLVLHKHAAPNGLEAEKQANEFAAAFLMPEAPLRAVGRITGLPQVVDLKTSWAVSVAAMTYRLHELGLASKWTYQQLFVEISRRGWRTTEPRAIRREQSQVWKKVLDDLRQNGGGVEGLSAMLSIPESEIVKLLFGLVTVAVPSSANTTLTPGRGNLRLVK
ncbi:XRE family transcriptional regulator [Agrobacterium tumefaciens]|uniref:XRE family transcriptional regulator n=1 Tax=Agrobacterium tumefaciens TaxID=358 RepID=UPI000DDC9F6C|nr:XRE family transcriptional regulator [Agrobacterium tumefaciens]MBP2537493.1 Zn-dependent peptidase ImmA (M78 family)/DNA-binding XRE family transcriptional regulator [Agrobacterium tumefaciens]MDP9791014.1 Zn-dependent peptidase ImmA (M78 family)/DNA-binding XRE family transcriptional regulator [Agrobacterium tumefaciens]